MKQFELPTAPASQSGPVKAWSQPVVIPTYVPFRPDKNPMFLEKRVYQGSSGRIYPLPFTDRISSEAREQSWQALHIENEFVRVMVLPEIGGRIHVGLDKTNGYNFFYRQNVIKPALVGLAGPWISGGVEFNWPQHHRPATSMPVDFQIEQHPDGSQTIWCSDHDPLNRLKGMHGVCLHPGNSYIELKVRLYNRTPFVQTFLWWANVAVHVHELYQSFFPPDVRFVADHAKRAVSRFPLCDGRYYGVDYGQRAKQGVPEEERPRKFVPPGTYAPNDLTWYANIPVPTSYMALGSVEDFCGGYDHKLDAGLVHIADHHISPGKKQWTWGNHEFGYAWDRNLTDEDGPYIELMAGVFTDNQPDFSFLAPGETKSFHQFWYPIRQIGPVVKANKDAALSLTVDGGKARVGICATRSFPDARVSLRACGHELATWTRHLAPASPFLELVLLPSQTKDSDLAVVVQTDDYKDLLHYTAAPLAKSERPAPATEPLLPEEISNGDELYLTGLHLEQYRHATRLPEAYWREALRRDPGDSRCNNAMGLWHLRRGEFQQAEQHFRQVIVRLTQRNPNPADGEPHYNLGLTLRYLERDAEAHDAFAKAAWNHAWQSPSYLALAEIEAMRGDWRAANQYLAHCLQTNRQHLAARNLAVMVLRKLGEDGEASRLLQETLGFDPMDWWARYLSQHTLPSNNQMLLDLAIDHARAGFLAEAIDILEHANLKADDGSVPTLLYAIGSFRERRGDTAAAKASYAQASEATPDYCFSHRLEEMCFLQAALLANPEDARAAYYLGNLLYDRRRHREAIAHWEQSARFWPDFSVVWRNLGIAYFNVLGDAERARAAFDQALLAAPDDARVLYERDQLWKRIGVLPVQRLAELEKFPQLITLRDDLTVELAALYNQTRQHEKAFSLIQSRRFQPWEGGEGMALGQHVRTHLALGRRALAGRDFAEAIRLFKAALDCPENLGEARHLLANQSDIFYWLGVAFDACRDSQSARQWWERAAGQKGDFQEMSVRSFSELTFYSSLALARLGGSNQAEELLRSMLVYAEGLMRQGAKIDYFATSLPAMLLFEDDLQKRNCATAMFLEAQAQLGLGDTERAQQLLKRLLDLDPSQALGADFQQQLEDHPAALSIGSP